ncbi:MAG: hypothetical protein EP329_12055 [Deltaproteobacteria bacterium]|nr:MAG: hypothetical protein EP329_12055 [Deltaproteobacteria bacterium]
MDQLKAIGKQAVDALNGAQGPAQQRSSARDQLRGVDGLAQQEQRLSPAHDDASKKPQAAAQKLTVQQILAALKGEPAASAGVAPEATGVFTRAMAVGKSMREVIEKSKGAARYPSQTAFFVDIIADSVAAQLLTGVPASITMGQAAQETGYGKSASSGNNFFGIKGSGTAGSTREATWEEVNGRKVKTTAHFRAYKNRYESFVDHGKLISENPVYGDAMKHTEDPKKMIAEVHDAGYATDSKYTTNITWIMKTFGLMEIDPLARSLVDIVQK